MPLDHKSELVEKIRIELTAASLQKMLAYPEPSPI